MPVSGSESDREPCADHEGEWDVLEALGDLTLFFADVLSRSKGSPRSQVSAPPLPPPYSDNVTPCVVTQGEIGWMNEWVDNIQTVTSELIQACEKIVEEHADDPRLAPLKAALARSMGFPSDAYPRRGERW